MTQHEQGRSGVGASTTDKASQSAQAAADEARREARGALHEAKGAASDVASEASAAGRTIRNEAAGLAGAVRQGISQQAERQKNEFADRISAVADRVHETAEGLRDREAWLADIVDRGAREIEHFADDMKQRDIAGFAGLIESFARRQPALFLGATVALGFALTRVVRGATERTAYDDRYYGSGQGRSDYGYGRADYGRDYGRPDYRRDEPAYGGGYPPAYGTGQAGASGYGTGAGSAAGRQTTGSGYGDLSGSSVASGNATGGSGYSDQPVGSNARQSGSSAYGDLSGSSVSSGQDRNRGSTGGGAGTSGDNVQGSNV